MKQMEPAGSLMNGSLVVVGLVFFGVGLYVFLNPKKETETGLRRGGLNLENLDRSTQRRAVQRNKEAGGLVLSWGVVWLVVGIFEWYDKNLIFLIMLGFGVILLAFLHRHRHR